ncbi:esterase/lipase family protein [Nocardia arthritidis]|uniref:Alpha/beta fold hydrolase n=1 Tax=Nocardia arthritidis TaxID=228602 RepID=A0A6G9Y9H2_9NOCA|nr:alpha/beta fold hydrolase [Nocardia arthritidis]QIS09693.1 alpha/beta fold hydrolase [Nocardia arthritidis]
MSRGAKPAVAQSVNRIICAVLAASATFGVSTAVASAEPIPNPPRVAPGYAGSHSADTIGYGPELPDETAAFAYGFFNPDVAPQGANNWGCKPDGAHPRPVVLVHGTWANAYGAYAGMSPQLARAGYCVFTFNFGRPNVPGPGLDALLPGATGDIPESTGQLAVFVDRVLAATGADQVDMIAHSQGAVEARRYLKFNGGANPDDPARNKVKHLITYGGTNHGTSLDGFGTLILAIQSKLPPGVIDLHVPFTQAMGAGGIQQVYDSPVILELNEGGDTMPGVDYTIVGDRYDEVSTPFDKTFLTPGPGATVDNVVLQDGCPQDTSDHNSMLFSPRAISIALHALDPVAHPDLACTGNPWLL